MMVQPYPHGLTRGRFTGPGELLAIHCVNGAAAGATMDTPSIGARDDTAGPGAAKKWRCSPGNEPGAAAVPWS